MRFLILLGSPLAAAALFTRSYSLPPAPDRQGGTTVTLTSPLRPLFGSPRGDCIGTPADEVPVACLIASVARGREGIVLLRLPFCASCHDLSQRIAALGGDAAALRAKEAQIARFGW